MSVKNIQVRPFLKWAGGKSQLLGQLQLYFPQELNGKGIIKRYYEPFLGSGAVFFWVMQNCKIEKACINEFNSEIYLCYVSIQKKVEGLIKQLKVLEKRYHALSGPGQEAFYYRLRSEYNQTRDGINFGAKESIKRTAKIAEKVIAEGDFLEEFEADSYVKRSAMTIFLNRTCFNGLYRVNSEGGFNVPFGRYKNPTICDSRNLKAVSRILRGVTITNRDFSIIQEQIKRDSFVYFDPPYRPLSKTSNFTSYSTNEFNDEEQERLSVIFRRLSRVANVKIMLSNSDPKNINENDDFFESLYSGFRIERLKAKRMINCDASKRGKINELLIMNY